MSKKFNMKIQLLSFPGCPNAEPALHALREAMALDKVGDAIEEIDVSRPDAPAWVKGWGSPTILIEDADVSGETRSTSEASCRLYQGGAPSVAQIRARIAAARGNAILPAPMRSRVPLIGGIAAALASACCLVPSILAIVGVSGMGVASTLAPLRPYFLVATAIALGAGFWFAYRPSRAVDDCGCQSGGRIHVTGARAEHQAARRSPQATCCCSCTPTRRSLPMRLPARSPSSITQP